MQKGTSNGGTMRLKQPKTVLLPKGEFTTPNSKLIQLNNFHMHTHTPHTPQIQVHFQISISVVPGTLVTTQEMAVLPPSCTVFLGVGKPKPNNTKNKLTCSKCITQYALNSPEKQEKGGERVLLLFCTHSF